MNVLTRVAENVSRDTPTILAAQRSSFAIAVLLLFSCVGMNLVFGATPAEWPRFRGPNGSGQPVAEDAAALAKIPVQWTPQDYLWHADLPGIGNSSPVVSGGHVVVTAADAAKATFNVLCFDIKTGKQNWRAEFPSAPYHLHAKNTYATSTPAIDAQRVYATYTSPQKYAVVALNLADGTQAWQVDLGSFASQHGFGASPILYGDLLIVPNDQDGESFLVALDAGTGKEIWKTKRRGGVTSYSAPCIFEAPGRPPELIFTSSPDGMSGIDPHSGRQDWTINVFPQRTVGSPISAGGLILANCGQGSNGKTLVAVRPGATVDAPAKLEYEITDGVPYVTTPLAHDGLLFLWHDRGIASCHDLATGKRIWTKRMGTNVSGSPVLIGDRMYCIAEDGTVFVVAAAREYKLLARNPLGEGSRATPAVADGRLLLRTESKLFCVGSKPGS